MEPRMMADVPEQTPVGIFFIMSYRDFFRSISVSENQKPDNLGDKRVLTRDTRHSAGNCWQTILVTTSDLLDPDDNRLLCQGYPTLDLSLRCSCQATAA